MKTPLDAEAYYNRAMSKLQQGDFSGAIADCNKSIGINPNFFVVYYVRGLSKNDIEVEVADGLLTVRSVKENEENEESIYRGISYRKFNRKFTLADEIVVKDASLENGMLVISLERIVPEEKKPRKIKIK